MTIASTGEITMAGRDIAAPRLLVTRTQAGNSYPAILATVENNTNSSYPINMIVANASTSGRVKGNYSFAASAAAASAGTSIAGISYVDIVGATWDLPGMVFYSGSPTTQDDNTKDVFFIGNNGNVYVGYQTSQTSYPASKLSVANGDVYLSTAGRGIIMKSPDGNCWRTSVSAAGVLETQLLYNVSANQFQAFNGTKWGQKLFYSQEFWNVKGNPQTADNVTNIIGTADARVFTVRTNNIRSFTIEPNGQIRMEGRDISKSRLNIVGAAPNSIYPSIVALHSTGFGNGVRYPNDITLTNTGNSTLKGNLAFSQTVSQAEAGISMAGISYLDTGSSDSGFSLYTGGHPSSIEDTSLERVRIASSGNVGIGISSPVSKVQVQDGDIYIQDSSRGIVINASGTNCYRITVNNSGTLATNLITCP